MALELNIQICTSNDCKSLIINDLTGPYGAGNTTGYNAPNPLISNIEWVYMRITSPSGVNYTLTPSGFPTTDTTLEYEVLNTSVGLTSTDSITDGLWQFLYIMKFTTSSTIYQVSKAELFSCTSECCVSEMLADIEVDSSCDCCNDKSIDLYTKTKAFLDALKAAAKCGDINNFNSIQKIVNKLCKNNGCKTCK